jgi:hypothetical protein
MIFPPRNVLCPAVQFQIVLSLAETTERPFKNITQCVDMMHRVLDEVGDAYASSMKQMDKVASRKSVYDQISSVCFPMMIVSDVCYAITCLHLRLILLFVKPF